MMPDGEPNSTISIYEELCRAHDGIADFRAKLLALLPIASVAGVAVLITRGSDETYLSLLLPVGAFGILITIGLFLYELRGIQKCNALIKSAKRLESKMANSLGVLGAFNVRPKSVFKGLVGATGAALVIYPSVIGAWAYVATLGACESRVADSIPPMIAVAVAIASAAFGGVVLRLQQRGLDQLENKLDATLDHNNVAE